MAHHPYSRPESDRPPVAGPLTAAIYRWSARWLEGRPACELSLRGAAPELGAGALLSALLFSGVMAVLWTLKAYRVTGIAPGAALLLASAALGALTSAFVQELLFRGVLLRLLEERFGTWPALLGSSAGFGALHLISPSATVLSAVAVALEGGLLGAAYLLTRRLWLAIGLHAAWDFANDGCTGWRYRGPRGTLFPERCEGR